MATTRLTTQIILRILTLGVTLYPVLPRAVDERRPGQLEEGECGEFRNPVSDNMFILSPNYPFNYPDRLSCEKLIEAKPGYVARLFFLDFQLESSVNCWLDRLEIYKETKSEDATTISWELVGYYCGSHKPTLVLSENNIRLILHTDRYTTYKGFRGRLQYIANVRA